MKAPLEHYKNHTDDWVDKGGYEGPTRWLFVQVTIELIKVVMKAPLEHYKNHWWLFVQVTIELIKVVTKAPLEHYKSH